LRLPSSFHPILRALAVSCLLAYVPFSFTQARQAPQKPAENPTAKDATPAAPQNPAQIELLETKIRFEANGDSRKEVHARVHINSELGVRQFARLNFDYNRAFQNVEIPLVRITHASGGTTEILPSAITDNPNPVVVNAPAYQDVRVKSVRILGLQPGDLLEYRVITTVSHHPLAPDFWLDHSFDRTGVVSQEIFELDLPASPTQEIRFKPDMPPSIENSSDGDSARKTYSWHYPAMVNGGTSAKTTRNRSGDSEPDVAVSTFGRWLTLSIKLDEKLTPGAVPVEKISNYEESMQELLRRQKVAPEITAKTVELTRAIETNKGKLEAIYDFVSKKITTIDLPLGATGFVGRPAKEILAAGYATQEDKFVLFAALAAATKQGAMAALAGYCDESGVPRPSAFNHLLISVSGVNSSFWLDPSLEVAPFGMITPISQKCVFILNRGFMLLSSIGHEWQPIDRKLPFASRQKVSVDASLSPDGKLSAKVRYSLRADNELLLRVAFHQAPKEKWQELAQLLSLSDGFRGKVTSVTASDPYATNEPFTIEYELVQPKFVDWSKKPVRIPALLPQLGLPDPPAKPAAGVASSPIELGTPLEVETRATLHLPPDTTVQTPTGTSVQRDYATYASQYSAKGQAITASRHINFLLREIPAERAADYNAFLHAVQNDEAQDFTLDRPDSATGKRAPAKPQP
jgi:hypothetical protein